MSHRNKVEALLFSSGRKMTVEEISKLCKMKEEHVVQTLQELHKEYSEKKSSMELLQEGSTWKLTVREEHLPMVSKIVTETELNKAILETLAVIAFKYPVKQSEVIRIRNNKGYEHLTELEESGYITRQKYGRTRLIKLTQKFFDYFDLPRDRLKDTFETFEGLATAIESKEKEIEKMTEEQVKKAVDKGKPEPAPHTETREPEPEHVGQSTESAPESKVQAYDSTPVSETTEVTPVFDPTEGEVIPDTERMGTLDVYESQTKTEPEEKKEESEDKPEEEKKPELNLDAMSGGLQIKSEEEKATEKIKKDIDKGAAELLMGKKEAHESEETENNGEKEENGGESSGEKSEDGRE